MQMNTGLVKIDRALDHILTLVGFRQVRRLPGLISKEADSGRILRVSDTPPAGPGKHYGFTREQ